MSTNQKRLKVFSLALMALGILAVVGGVLVLTSSPMASVLRVPVAGAATSGTISTEVIGVLALVVGVYCLAVGVLGARAANNPRRVGAFRTLDVVLVVVTLAEVGLGALAGQVSWVEVVLAVLGVGAFVYAGRANREALDR